MEIVVGKMAGFCMGITRAVENTEKLLDNTEIFCIGELTHNKQVMEELEAKGLKVKENIEEVKDSSKVIFRAHGMTKMSYIRAKEKKLEIHDFTCPKVLALHDILEHKNNDGKFIFLLGEKYHPEIIGTKSFADEESIFVIETEDDIKNAIDSLRKSNKKSLFILSQTTFSLKKFDDLVEKIKENIENKDIDIEVYNSICTATELRQKETENISKEVDFMVIIGGKNSSNTRKLYDISSKNTKAIHIETKEELKDIDFSNFNKIGVMAGASTPKKSIDDTIKYLESRS